MQRPEKSCSQCRARKTKCDLRTPRCSSCQTRDLACQFEVRQKPGPPKGFKKQTISRVDGDIVETHSAPKQHRTGTKRQGVLRQPSAGRRHVPYRDNSTPPSDPVDDTEGGSVTRDGVTEVASSAEILDALTDHLTDVYIEMKLFPFLPQVTKQQLLEAAAEGCLGVAIISAVCAISAHLNPNVLFDHSTMSKSEAADMYAARAKSAYLRYTRDEDHPTSLTVIKTAAILSAYEMSCSPGIKGWAMVGEAVRLAYDMRLDQVDSPTHLISTFMSPADAEDARYVWWTVFSLDTYASSTLIRPFAITSEKINTAFVTTPENRFKRGEINGEQGSFLPTDLVGLQTAVLELDLESPINTQRLYLLVLASTRHLSTTRRHQLDGAEVEVQSDLVQNILATFRFSIPENFLGLRDGLDDTHLRIMRTEIVLLSELQTLGFFAHNTARHTMQQEQSPSTSLASDPAAQGTVSGYMDNNATFTYSNETDAYIQSAFSIVRIVRQLSSQDFALLSPMMASVLWLPAMTLLLHQRSRINDAGRANAASGMEVLKAALKKMGTIWTVAQNFHDALMALRADTTVVPGEISARYILQSYTSPLISISRSKNSVHIPSLLMPWFNWFEDPRSWASSVQGES